MNSSISSSDPTPYKRFIRRLLAVAFGILALVGVINLVADPYDSVRLVTVEGLNNYKPKRNSDGARISTGMDLLRGGFRTAFLGSSRTRTGMPIDVPALPGTELNGGLAGANIFETVRSAMMLIGREDVECIFSSVGKIKGSYWNSVLEGSPPLLSQVRTALSFQTLRRSLSTL